MKISIITLHSIHNPGSVLQALALQQFLKEQDYNVDIIDYRPLYGTIGKNKIKGILRKLLFAKNESKIKKKYEDFIHTHMELSPKKYKSYRALLKNIPLADVYISGSDQLWNLDYDCGRDDAYYLRFARQGRKISYATSIGKKKICDADILFIMQKIRDYDSISVREQSSSLNLMKKMKREIDWVCDPVFLLNKKFYLSLVTDINYNRYIVIYLSAQGEILNEVIRDIREKTEYKIVQLGGNRKRCDCDLLISEVDPVTFLSYIYNAEYVISSSFHATAFSHIFHKKFGVILPERNGERIEDLLKLTGLKFRIIDSITDIQRIYTDIDYDIVDIELSKFIDKSKKYLTTALS